jgi:hypothetical protein
MSMFETTTAAAPAAPAIPPYSTAEMRSYPLGTLVVRAGLMPLETVNRALAEAADSHRRLVSSRGCLPHSRVRNLSTWTHVRSTTRLRSSFHVRQLRCTARCR